MHPSVEAELTDCLPSAVSEALAWEGIVTLPDFAAAFSDVELDSWLTTFAEAEQLGAKASWVAARAQADARRPQAAQAMLDRARSETRRPRIAHSPVALGPSASWSRTSCGPDYRRCGVGAAPRASALRCSLEPKPPACSAWRGTCCSGIPKEGPPRPAPGRNCSGGPPTWASRSRSSTLVWFASSRCAQATRRERSGPSHRRCLQHCSHGYYIVFLVLLNFRPKQHGLARVCRTALRALFIYCVRGKRREGGARPGFWTAVPRMCAPGLDLFAPLVDMWTAVDAQRGEDAWFLVPDLALGRAEPLTGDTEILHSPMPPAKLTRVVKGYLLHLGLDARELAFVNGYYYSRRLLPSIGQALEAPTEALNSFGDWAERGTTADEVGPQRARAAVPMRVRYSDTALQATADAQGGVLAQFTLLMRDGTLPADSLGEFDPAEDWETLKRNRSSWSAAVAEYAGEEWYATLDLALGEPRPEATHGAGRGMTPRSRRPLRRTPLGGVVQRGSPPRSDRPRHRPPSRTLSKRSRSTRPCARGSSWTPCGSCSARWSTSSWTTMATPASPCAGRPRSNGRRYSATWGILSMRLTPHGPCTTCFESLGAEVWQAAQTLLA